MPKVNIEVQVDSIEEMDRVADKVCEVIRKHPYVAEATIRVGQTNFPCMLDHTCGDVIIPNEERKKFGLAPIPGGDVAITKVSDSNKELNQKD